MMSFLRQAFHELYENDGLLVMAVGLGIRHVLVKFIKHFCISHPKESRKQLVFVINAKGEEDMLLDATSVEGVPKDLLPKVLTNEFSIKDRAALYKVGGVFIVTSRILVVDLLNDVVDPGIISGFLVHRAHRLEETCTETFILRLFRQKNNNGFIKGFTENPEALVRGFGQTEKVLRALHVPLLFVWPRFRAEVVEVLEQCKPILQEWLQDLTPAMNAVQQAVAITMDVCLKELRKRAPSLDMSELTIEHGLFESFDVTIRQQLDSEWHRVRPDTRQLISDLSTLRKLLEYMFRYDSVTFYGFLRTLRSAASQQQNPSMWLTMDAADRLFKQSKSRVFNIVEVPSKKKIQLGSSTEMPTFRLQRVLEENPKWRLVDNVLEQALSEKSSDKNFCISSCPCLLIMVKDESTSAQLQEYLNLGGKTMMNRRFLKFLNSSNAKIRSRLATSSVQNRENHADTVSESDGGYISNEKDINGLTDVQTLNKNQNFVSASMIEQDLLLKEEDLLQCELLQTDSQKTCDVSCSTKRKQDSLKETEKSTENSRRKTKVLEKNTAINSKLKRKRAACLEDSLDDVERDGAFDAEAYIKQQNLCDNSIYSKNSRNVKDRCSFTFEPIQDVHIVIYTYAQASESLSILDTVQPQHILMYDPDISFIREIELYAVRSHPLEFPLTVHFAVYKDSAEHQKFLTTLKRESKAFATLIDEKGRMIIPLSAFNVPIIETPLHDTRLAILSSRKDKSDRPKLAVVDVREFRSALPSLLHMHGFLLAPHTVTVGDYILSPDLCIERKSISDLFQSFTSGRLWNQAEAMCRYYKKPILLIEFSLEKSFSLQSPGQITSEIRLDAICSKIVLLTMNFPQLRLLWSRSPHVTVDIFASLLYRESPVDIQLALSAGNDSSEDLENGTEMNSSAKELLLKLPGVTANNYRALMRTSDSIYELSNLTLSQLQDTMGKVGGRQLYIFFHEQPPF